MDPNEILWAIGQGVGKIGSSRVASQIAEVFYFVNSQTSRQQPPNMPSYI